MGVEDQPSTRLNTCPVFLCKFASMGNLKDPKTLNKHMGDKSYLEGFTPSLVDTQVFESLGSSPSCDLPHALRWYKQIQSYGDLRNNFRASAGAVGIAPAQAKVETKDEDDDDVYLFGSDSEEEDAEAAKIRDERLKAYAEKKGKKPGPIAKSSVILDCKPWDDETDMKQMEDLVRTIECEGLLWGASKLVELAYGIKKLQIMCVVEDGKVSIEWLQEEIEKNEDHVQSVDIAAFNKI